VRDDPFRKFSPEGCSSGSVSRKRRDSFGYGVCSSGTVRGSDWICSRRKLFCGCPLAGLSGTFPGLRSERACFVEYRFSLVSSAKALPSLNFPFMRSSGLSWFSICLTRDYPMSSDIVFVIKIGNGTIKIPVENIVRGKNGPHALIPAKVPKTQGRCIPGIIFNIRQYTFFLPPRPGRDV